MPASHSVLPFRSKLAKPSGHAWAAWQKSPYNPWRCCRAVDRVWPRSNLCFKKLCLKKKEFYIWRHGSTFWAYFLREFDSKSSVATLLLHSADPKEGGIMFIRWTRKFAKSDSCLRIILNAMRLHSSLSKSLGQDRYLDDIIHTLAARRGASRSQRERLREEGRGKAVGQRERDVYSLRLSLSNPLFTSLGVKSSRAPFLNRQLRGWEGTPALFCEVFIKLQWITPLALPSYATASLFISVEQKAASVSTSVERRKADRRI